MNKKLFITAFPTFRRLPEAQKGQAPLRPSFDPNLKGILKVGYTRDC